MSSSQAGPHFKDAVLSISSKFMSNKWTNKYPIPGLFLGVFFSKYWRRLWLPLHHTQTATGNPAEKRSEIKDDINRSIACHHRLENAFRKDWMNMRDVIHRNSLVGVYPCACQSAILQRLFSKTESPWLWSIILSHGFVGMPLKLCWATVLNYSLSWKVHIFNTQISNTGEASTLPPPLQTWLRLCFTFTRKLSTRQKKVVGATSEKESVQHETRRRLRIT